MHPHGGGGMPRESTEAMGLAQSAEDARGAAALGSRWKQIKGHGKNSQLSIGKFSGCGQVGSTGPCAKSLIVLIVSYCHSKRPFI
jgi:hypothetical protein